jgi:hypothetical protein
MTTPRWKRRSLTDPGRSWKGAARLRGTSLPVHTPGEDLIPSRPPRCPGAVQRCGAIGALCEFATMPPPPPPPPPTPAEVRVSQRLHCEDG